jgi:hypothetical protein
MLQIRATIDCACCGSVRHNTGFTAASLFPRRRTLLCWYSCLTKNSLKFQLSHGDVTHAAGDACNPPSPLPSPTAVLLCDCKLSPLIALYICPQVIIHDASTVAIVWCMCSLLPSFAIVKVSLMVKNCQSG